MTRCNAPAQPIAETGSDAIENRQRKVEQLYQNNYHFLIDTALADRSLYVADAERIVEQVGRNLPDYNGPLTDEDFRQWSAHIIQPAVARIAAFSKLKTENAKYVYGGIW